ncbi:unnamed protein product [Phytomonas sp. Hart1]|nr:unnamed protein product [Phytomonas sp. Hart1]|eukprot:CCW67451.1 unnamed protein product [Phytomonas sp. isolate Hart1]
MNEENYVAGELGLVFSNATPLTYPTVAQYLRKRLEDMDEDDKAKGLIDSCYQQVNMLQESCTNEYVVSELHRLRLRTCSDEGEVVSNTNIPMSFDDYNIHHIGADASGTSKVRLKEFEVVALGTLVPKNVEEALVLIPSLSRYEVEDLREAIALLEQ